jgi:antirestriction protein ArdC
MNRKNHSAYHNTQKAAMYKDIYQTLTDYVLQTLEKGEVIWQRGWNTLGLDISHKESRLFRSILTTLS